MSQRPSLPRLEGMLTWFLRRKLAAFEKQYDYDASYMRHLLDTDPSALIAFARVQGLSAYRKDVPPDLYCAVGLTGTIAADCGPCAQLGITMALRQGVPAATIARIVRGNLDEMTEPTRLGVRFARAVLARDAATADELREEITRRHGPRAVIALGFALVASQMYPTLKYALGYGHACSRLQVEGTSIAPGTPRLAVA